VYKKIIVLYLTLITFSTLVFAQNDNQPEKKHKIIFSFDNRNTFILGSRAAMSGIKFGVEHNKRHRFGMGIYAIKSKTFILLGQQQITYEPQKGVLRDTLVDLFAGLDYLTLYYEYVWLSKKRWEIATPVSFGFGTASVNYTLNKEKITYKSIPILSIESVVGAHYKIFSWVGIGVGIGYRKIIYSDKTIGHRLDAPLYILKVKLFLGSLFKKNDE